MNRRCHATLARMLIEACGGLDEAVRTCRVSKAQLSNYQNPLAEPAAFMPADVMVCLEAHCGEPIYSKAIVEACEPAKRAADLVTEALEATESVVHLQAAARRAAADRTITPNDRGKLIRLHAEATRDLREVGEVLGGGDGEAA